MHFVFVREANDFRRSEARQSVKLPLHPSGFLADDIFLFLLRRLRGETAHVGKSSPDSERER